jgi:hypothetical protein
MEVRLYCLGHEGEKGPIVPWGGEGTWRRTRGFLELRTHRSFSITVVRWRWWRSAESWWRLLLFFKSGLGLYSCNARFVFFIRATSLFAPLARRAGLA